MLKQFKSFVEDKQDKEDSKLPPAVLVMRRKSVRLFPNGQNVAMYYIDKLDKYITVPFSAMPFQTHESTAIDVLKSIDENVILEYKDESQVEVTPELAKEIVSVHRKVNEENKKKMEEMLATSAEYFNKVLEFARNN
jgi:hypothetical protein